MPRVPKEYLDCAFYLYRSREAAEEGEQRGGTGFIVGLPSAHQGYAHLYGVSARHVVHRDGHSAIRLNTRDGGFDVLPLEPHEWKAHPDGDDVAVVSLVITTNIHKVIWLSETMLLREGANVEPGDDIFMIGRFVNHEGKQRNEPSVRFGNISIGLAPIRLPSGYIQSSYSVEMRSMAGYSGSPVFVYYPPFSSIGGPLIVSGRMDVWLLGLNWGYITDEWEITRHTVPIPSLTGMAAERQAEFVRANTGMNGVVPAWKIMEVINLPVFQQMRATEDAELKITLDRKRGGAEFADEK